MNKIIKILAPLLVVAASILIVIGLSAAKPEPEKKEESQRLVSLYVDEVQSELVTITVKAQGEVTPKNEIDLIPQVSGRIVSIADEFAEGAEFQAHASLIKIDDTSYKLAVVRAQAKVAGANVSLQRELANAKIKADEWSKKRNKGVPTPFALNKPQVLEAEASLRAAKADLEEARLNVKRTTLSVPFRGRVAEKAVGVGQYVTAGTRLGRVFSTDTVQIRLALTDVQLGELNLPMGFMATAADAPVVYLTAKVGNTQQAWEGRIVRINAAVDKQTRMIYAIAEVEDPYGLGANAGVPIAVGMFVNAEIISSDSQSVLVVPRLALRSADKIYVINADNRLEIRTVNVLSTSPERVLIGSGIEPGEEVVTSAVPAAVDGMEVRAITRQPQI